MHFYVFFMHSTPMLNKSSLDVKSISIPLPRIDEQEESHNSSLSAKTSQRFVSKTKPKDTNVAETMAPA